MSNHSAPQVMDRTSALLQSYRLLEAMHKALEQGQAELERNIGWPVCIEGCGKCCQHHTPVALNVETAYIMSTLAILPGMRDKLLQKSFDWLTHEHAGVSLYNKVRGIPKDQDIIKQLEHERAVITTTQCPFLDGTECLIHGARPITCRAYGVTLMPDEWCPRHLHYTETSTRRMIVGYDTKLGGQLASLMQKLANTSPIGFLPTMIARELDLSKLQALVPSIADAKLGVGRGIPRLFGAAHVNI